MSRGPVEFVVLQFPGAEPAPALAPALQEQVDKGLVRIIDLLFVAKGPTGTLRAIELSELHAAEGYADWQTAVQSVDGLIAVEDITEVTERLPAGSMAVLILFEHVWLKELSTAVRAAGGHLAYSERIPADVVDAVAEAAKAGV